MRLCPYPFSRMQTKNEQTNTELAPGANQAAFFPCCPSWLNRSYWDMGFEKNLEDIWNGKAAVELRKKIYEGDYSFCNRHECKIPLLTIEEMADPDINFLETPISPENIQAIKDKNPIMPSPPSSLHLVADLRCNLKCPSCRPEVISNTTPSIEADDEYDFVHQLKGSVEIIKMSSAGEVFYSRVQRNLLKSFNTVDFPKLKRIHIVSNGTLLNQKTYTDLLPGTSFIKDISISIDAGSKEVYEKLRGPYWEQVVSNLEWLGQMRMAGRIEMLSLNFTLVRDNYRDIPSLVALAKKNHVDRILIQKYLSGPKQGYVTYQEQLDQAVHLTNHPEHIHMIRTLEMFKDEPILHTLLDIDGYEDKLEDNVNRRKAMALTKKIHLLFEQDQIVEAFDLINEVLHGERLTSAQLDQVRGYFEKGIFDLTSPIPVFSFRKATILNDEHTIFSLSSSIENFIFKFQEKGEYVKSLNFATILSFIKPIDKINVFYSMATCLKELSRFSEAETLFSKALEQDKENNEYLIQLAFIKKNNAEYEEAYHYFAQVDTEEAKIQMKELSFTIFYKNQDLAFAAKKNNQPTEALFYFKKALAFMPKEEDMNENLKKSSYYLNREMGFILLENGDYSSALDAFSSAQIFEPDTKKEESTKQVNKLRYYLNRDMGFLLQKNGEYARAIEAFKEAETFESEEEKGESAKQINALNTDLNCAIGLKLKQDNNYSQAIEAFEKAKTYASSTNKEEIINYINESLYYVNENLYYLKRDQGFSLQQAGKYVEASEVFNEALKHRPGDADLFFSLGISLKRQKDYTQAKIILNKAVAHKPDHYWALMELGAIEFLEGKNREALNYYHEAKKYEPADKKDYSRKYVLMAERKLLKEKP